MSDVRTNWQRLDDGGWGVKLQGRGVANAQGRTVLVVTRAGKHSRVTLGRRVARWNGDRAAVYEVAS